MGNDLQIAFDFIADGPFVRTAEPMVGAEPAAGTLNALVLSIISDGKWVMPWEICERLRHEHQLRVSDSSVTARLRDLRKDKFGRHSIELRKRDGSRAYEYRLMK